MKGRGAKIVILCGSGENEALNGDVTDGEITKIWSSVGIAGVTSMHRMLRGSARPGGDGVQAPKCRHTLFALAYKYQDFCQEGYPSECKGGGASTAGSIDQRKGTTLEY